MYIGELTEDGMAILTQQALICIHSYFFFRSYEEIRWDVTAATLAFDEVRDKG